MKLPKDIESLIDERFKDRARVLRLLGNLENQKEEHRVIRCILELSDSDYDSIDAWVKKANEDYRNVIWYAEYDHRNARKFDFNNPLNSQVPYACKE
jgi:hypothetical protein